MSQNFISCFQHVAKDIERWLNFGASYLVYSQIWLNLPGDDHHFFNIFLWMIPTLAVLENVRRKTLVHSSCEQMIWEIMVGKWMLDSYTEMSLWMLDSYTEMCLFVLWTFELPLSRNEERLKCRWSAMRENAFIFVLMSTQQA